MSTSSCHRNKWCWKCSENSDQHQHCQHLRNRAFRSSTTKHFLKKKLNHWAIHVQSWHSEHLKKQMMDAFRASRHSEPQQHCQIVLEYSEHSQQQQNWSLRTFRAMSTFASTALKTISLHQEYSEPWKHLHQHAVEAFRTSTAFVILQETGKQHCKTDGVKHSEYH